MLAVVSETCAWDGFVREARRAFGGAGNIVRYLQIDFALLVRHVPQTLTVLGSTIGVNRSVLRSVFHIRYKVSTTKVQQKRPKKPYAIAMLVFHFQLIALLNMPW